MVLTSIFLFVFFLIFPASESLFFKRRVNVVAANADNLGRQ